MPKTLSVTALNAVGTISYSWSFVQSTGTIVSGTSLTPDTNPHTAVFDVPTSITYAGLSSGTYKFDFTVTATDSGVANCTSTRTISLYYNDTPPSCTLTLSTITVS